MPRLRKGDTPCIFGPAATRTAGTPKHTGSMPNGVRGFTIRPRVRLRCSNAAFATTFYTGNSHTHAQTRRILVRVLRILCIESVRSVNWYQHVRSTRQIHTRRGSGSCRCSFCAGRCRITAAISQAAPSHPRVDNCDHKYCQPKSPLVCRGSPGMGAAE